MGPGYLDGQRAALLLPRGRDPRVRRARGPTLVPHVRSIGRPQPGLRLPRPPPARARRARLGGRRVPPPHRARHPRRASRLLPRKNGTMGHARMDPVLPDRERDQAIVPIRGVRAHGARSEPRIRLGTARPRLPRPPEAPADLSRAALGPPARLPQWTAWNPSPARVVRRQPRPARSLTSALAHEPDGSEDEKSGPLIYRTRFVPRRDEKQDGPPGLGRRCHSPDARFPLVLWW